MNSTLDLNSSIGVIVGGGDTSEERLKRGMKRQLRYHIIKHDEAFESLKYSHVPR